MLIFPLLKASETGRRVYALLDEGVDRGGEAMDYAASAPVFKAWSATQAAASGGKSFGNVRAQHDVRAAAGVVSSITFDDEARSIGFEIDVLDDGAWDKLLKGLFTGISPGGKARRYRDANGTQRYAVTSLNEISLVDIPCAPNAGLTLLKADGGEEVIAFAPAADGPDMELLKAMADAPSPTALAALTAWMSVDDLEKALGGTTSLSVGNRVGGNCGEAMPDGSFPVVTQVDLDAGLSVLEKAADPDAARAHLAARAAALGLVMAGDTKLEKGMDSVSRLSALISSLTWLAGDVTCEAGDEADGSLIPARLVAWLADGAVILTDMAGEEAAELIAGLAAAVATLPVVAAPMEKAAGLGAEGLGLLLKVSGDLAAARDDLTKAHAARAGMEAELNRYRALPAPGGARLMAVSRGEDVTATETKDDPAAMIAAMPDGVAKANALMKRAMAAAVQPRA